MANEGAESSDAWYEEHGEESDVVVSTRVRLARDLADFPFPMRFRDGDAQRVRATVFDAFLHCSDSEKYQSVITSQLDFVGRLILCERGVIRPTTPVTSGTGIVIRNDGVFSCVVNDGDHLKLSAFRAGMNGVGAFEICKKIDDELQNSLQFAASREHGYLTSFICDCGSGMRVSFRVHLPAISFAGKVEENAAFLEERGLGIRDCFGVSAEKTGTLGSFYEIFTKTGGNGSEIDQMANILGALKTIVEIERHTSEELFKTRITEIKDRVYKAYAGAKFSFLCTARSAVETLSAIKWGKNLGLLDGVTDGDLAALIYRIQTGHIQFVMRNRQFKFPDDIERSRTLSENHIRAMLLQETLGKLTF